MRLSLTKIEMLWGLERQYKSHWLRYILLKNRSFEGEKMSCCENDRTLGNRPMRRGAPGESAYEFWKEHQPLGTDTSECAFEKFMEGKPGESAYEFWKSRQPPGSDTSEQAFADSMKGKDGISVEDKIRAKDQSIITTETIVDKTHKTMAIGVQLSSKKENTLTLENDGLFSPMNTGGQLFFDKKAFAGTGTKDEPYQVKIKSGGANILGMNDDGLYAPLSFNTPGFEVDEHVIHLSMSKKAGNALTLEQDGLFSPQNEDGKLFFDPLYFKGTGTKTDPYQVSINSDPPSIVSWSINGIYAPLAFDSNAFKVYQGYDVYL
ncbi:hypothetical protein PSI23_10800, partial [Xenorhabdus sp. XENO-10]